MLNKIVYYDDPVNDDFANNNINTQQVNADYKFISRNIFFIIFSFIFYYFIAIPIVYMFSKIILGVKFKNKKAIRKLKFKKEGYFIYGNHTHDLDGFIPYILNFPKRTYTISNPDVISIPGIRPIVRMLGLLPIPNNISVMKKLLAAIFHYHDKGSSILIYPEAHIWPYYTKIRPFVETSFRYPVNLSSKSIAVVTTYRKRLFFKKPGMTVYVSDVFEVDYSLDSKSAQIDLRNRIYDWMSSISEKPGNYETIKYIKRGN